MKQLHKIFLLATLVTISGCLKNSYELSEKKQYFTKDTLACKDGNSRACLRQQLASHDKRRMSIELKMSMDFLKKQDQSDRNNGMLMGLIDIHTDQANRLLKQLCDGNDEIACFTYALRLGANTDKTESIDKKIYYEKAKLGLVQACGKSDGFACYILSLLMMTNIDKKDSENQISTLNYLSKACDANDPSACAMLGGDYYHKSELEQAKKYIKKGCELGASDACSYYAMIISKDGHQSYAIQMLEDRCSHNDGKSCNDVTVFYSEKDTTRIYGMLHKACSFGFTDSCLRSGQIYKGNGKTGEAKVEFQSLCDADSGDGCFELAEIELELGNAKKAEALYQKGCDLQNAKACLKAFGIGTKSQKASVGYLKKAKEILNQSCDRGDEESCNMLRKLVATFAKINIRL